MPRFRRGQNCETEAESSWVHRLHKKRRTRPNTKSHWLTKSRRGNPRARRRYCCRRSYRTLPHAQNVELSNRGRKEGVMYII